jgi:nicotinamide phosphoribosyltransferase
MSFYGTDTIPAIDLAEYGYGGNVIAGSVAATEHSVMCAGLKESELDTFRRLLDLYPTGILSVVSDTWNLWTVVTEYMVTLREEILKRDGKLVIRPDSGDPVKIICGAAYPVSAFNPVTVSAALDAGYTHVVYNGIYYKLEDRPAGVNEKRSISFTTVPATPELKGVIELLWDVFGGTKTSTGFRMLDSHIGAIYGDSITYDRAQAILEQLRLKKFASGNIVFGVGSFTYQFVTRDTFNFAMKSTWTQRDGVG